MKMASPTRDHAGSVPIHETDLQLAYRIEQYQAARDRRQCCLNDIEREGGRDAARRVHLETGADAA